MSKEKIKFVEYKEYDEYGYIENIEKKQACQPFETEVYKILNEMIDELILKTEGHEFILNKEDMICHSEILGKYLSLGYNTLKNKIDFSDRKTLNEYEGLMQGAFSQFFLSESFGREYWVKEREKQ